MWSVGWDGYELRGLDARHASEAYEHALRRGETGIYINFEKVEKKR